MDLDVILDARAKPAALAELGEIAEGAGIRGAWVSSLNDSRDPFANLVPLAQRTTRLVLGPVAVNPFDTHPFRIAASFMTLNELAGGRARIVVGGGGEALEALGLRPVRRVRAVREAVQIIRAASLGRTVNYEGEIYQVRNCRLGWLEAPPPPLYVGAGQEQMLRMAAWVADGVMMSDLPPGAAARTLALLDGFLAARGRARPGFRTSAFTAWHVGPDAREARLEARRWLFLRGIFRPWLLAEILDPADADLVMSSRPAFQRAFLAGSPDVGGVRDAVLDALVDRLTLCAAADRLDPVLERLTHLRDTGLSSVALRLYADPAASIRLLGERLLPALR